MCIRDSIGAILIIAAFSTAQISFTALIVFAICVPFLALLNRNNVVSRTPYMLIGLIMWVATLKSGVHATLAGVVLAMFIPMRCYNDPNLSPVKKLEHTLHPLVTFFVLPIFAFANAGINFDGVGLEQLMHGVPVGIALGLFVGKQVGIFGLCWLSIKCGLVSLPKDMSWAALYGTSALCGIGFTMSLFIGSLAFQDAGQVPFDERIGIILGSLMSGVLGYFLLNKTLPPAK